eukprot:904113_1
MAAPANYPMKMPPQMAQKMKKMAGTINSKVNLNNNIKTIRVLNRNESESTISDKAFGENIKPNKHQYIMSDADEELLILIEFKEDVDLETISFHADIEKKSDNDNDEECDYSAPKQVYIDKIESLNLDFDDAKKMKNNKNATSLKLKSKKLKSEGGHILKLKSKAKTSIKFGKLNKLMIYIASNQDDAEQTYISGIKFQGNASAKTDMSRWNDVKCKS